MTTAVTALLCYMLPYTVLIFNFCTLSSLRVAAPFCGWIDQGKPLHRIQTPLRNAQCSEPLMLDVAQHIPGAITTIDGDYSKFYKMVKQTSRKCKDSNLWGRRECRALILPLHPYCNWSAGQKLQCQPAYLSILLTASPWTKALVPALGQIHPVIFPAWELGFLTGNAETGTEKPEQKCHCATPASACWRSPAQPVVERSSIIFQERSAPKPHVPAQICFQSWPAQFHHHTFMECVGWRSQDLF